jgi:hypothetical protein
MITPPRRAVLDELARRGGSLVDEKGQATAALGRAIGRPIDTKHGVSAFTSLLQAMEKDELIMRNVQPGTRRTYEIMLMVDWPIPPPTEAELTPNAPAEATLAPETREAADEALELPEGLIPSAGQIIPMPERHRPEEPSWSPREVADELLRMVLDRAFPEPIKGPEVLRRLGEQMELTARLKDTLAAREWELERLGNELAAVKSERNGLRNQLRQVQENFERLKNEKNRDIDTEVRRRIEAFMRERPRPLE